MNPNKTILLNSLSASAFERLKQLEGRIAQTNDTFEKRLGGKSSSGVAGSIFAALFWAVVLIGAGFALNSQIYNMWNFSSDFGMACTIVTVVASIVTVVLTILLISQSVSEAKFVSTIKAKQTEMAKMKTKIQKDADNLNQQLFSFNASEKSGWDYAFESHSSVIAEVSRIEESVRNLEEVSNVKIQKALLPFYHMAALLWCACFILTTFGLAMQLGEGVMYEIFDTSGGDAVIAILAILAIASISFQPWFASRIYRWQDNKVNNTTTLAMFTGVLAFWVALFALILVALIVYLVISAVIAILGIIVAIAIAAGIIGAIAGG